MTGTRRHWSVALASGILAAMAATPATRAEVAVFQQGASPTPRYAGCVDTFVENYGYTSPKDTSPTMWTAGSRNVLVRFDLSSIQKDRLVQRAILRLSLTEMPRFNQTVDAYALARDWDATAMWESFKAINRKPSPEHKWATPGGDVDKDGDFGAGAPGLVARAAVRGGPFGHIVELDVTKLVSEWIQGRRPNHGFFITKEQYSGATFATAEWPMPAYRPALAIEHYAADEKPDPKARLALPEPPGKTAALSPLATTEDAAAVAGEATVVRFGSNANCQYRGGHMAGYAKQDVGYPGNWGWTGRIRLGGTGGDLNHAVLYFDVSAIGKTASIRRATLKAFVEAGNQRVPDQTLALGQVPAETDKQRVERARASIAQAGELANYALGLFAIEGDGPAPGWSQHEFTFAQSRSGSAWRGPSGTLVEATSPVPVAVADLGQQWAEMLKQQDVMPETWISWDVTGVVRAWAQGKAPNRGLVLDHRLMGGEMVVYSDEWIDADRRPYLEVELVGEPAAKPDGPFQPEPLIGPEDSWVEPMRTVHARWKGVPGTFSQYGDSITVTMAFWTPLKGGTFTGGPEAMHKALEVARQNIHKDVWYGWKDGKYGCAGSTTISWAFDNIDQWQKRMNAESAVIMWGTNDAAQGPHVPIYTEKYAVVVNRVLADGTVPILTTLPPFGRQRDSMGMFMRVWNLRLAELSIARANRLPVIDLWAEIVKRRPDDWDGRMSKFDEGGWKGYNVPTLIARDGIHPSFSQKYQTDWSAEGLRSCGLGLRNYLTLEKWHQVHEKVLKASPTGAEDTK